VWLELQPDGSFIRRPNVFLDSSLPLADTHGTCRAHAPTNSSGGLASPAPDRIPACAWIGNINLPVDMRQIPLATPVKNSSAGVDSLALAAVEAYETSLDRKPKLRDNPRIADSIAEDHFVYGSFIPESQFQTIPIDALASAAPDALADCRGRIVLIGGNWHSDLGNGDLVDRHNTPVGPMVGMFAHANYIEALLDERYTREVPLWVGLGFDLIAGAALYMLFHRAKGWLAQLVVLVVPATLLAVSYIIFTNLNYYLDFILPLAACFVHLCVEYFHDYVHLRSHQALQSARGH
jgi:CHASE2 domain-containing sensor protein